MKIKKGDLVKVLAGKDKGESGRVLKALPPTNQVVVEGLNLIVKHRRPRREGEKGQKIQYPTPLAVSKVMLLCPHCQKPTRVGHRFLGEKQKKERICKKCLQVI